MHEPRKKWKAPTCGVSLMDLLVEDGGSGMVRVVHLAMQEMRFKIT